MVQAMKAFILALLQACTLQASDPWTKTEIALEATYQIVLFIDWKQTSEFHRYRQYLNYPKTDPYGHTITGPEYIILPIHEINPLLGRYPSQAKINMAYIISSVGHLAISNMLTHRQRLVWQSTTLLIEAFVVKDNYKLGITIKW